MAKGIRVLSWVLAAAVLAGLGGCGKTQAISESSVRSGVSSTPFSETNESVSVTNTSEGDGFEDSSIINTAFTRDVLAVKPLTSTEDFYTATEKWLVSFAEENYKSYSPSEIKANIYHPAKYILNDIYFLVLNCSVSFHTDSKPKGLSQKGKRGSISLQTVIYVRDDALQLVGFVTNQNRQIIEPSELVSFLKGSPIFKYKSLDYPHPRPPVSIPIQPVVVASDYIETGLPYSSSAIKLSPLFGELWICDICFLTDKNLIGILATDLGYNTYKEGAVTKIILIIFAEADMRPLYQAEFTLQEHEDITFYKSGESGYLLFNHSGDDYYDDIYYDITESGISEIQPEEVFRHRLSDSSCILEEFNSLVLEQNGETKLLIAGDSFKSSLYSCGYNYYFYCRFSDTEFAFEQVEGPLAIRGGVYDIETDELTMMVHENAEYLFPRTFNKTQMILTPELGDRSSDGPYLYDSTTGELTDLAWSDFEYEFYMEFDLVENNLFFGPFYYQNLETKAEKSINIPDRYLAEDPIIELFLTDHYAYMSLLPDAPSNPISNTYLIQIPIEEVMK